MKLNWFLSYMLSTVFITANSIYFGYYYLTRLGFGFSFLDDPKFKYGIFLLEYLFSPIGGVLSLLCLITFILGFILHKVERNRMNKEIEAEVKIFLKEINNRK